MLNWKFYYSSIIFCFLPKGLFIVRIPILGGCYTTWRHKNFVAGDQKSKMVKSEGISVTTGIAEEYMTLHVLETGGKINQNSPFCWIVTFTGWSLFENTGYVLDIVKSHCHLKLERTDRLFEGSLAGGGLALGSALQVKFLVTNMPCGNRHLEDQDFP